MNVISSARLRSFPFPAVVSRTSRVRGEGVFGVASGSLEYINIENDWGLRFLHKHYGYSCLSGILIEGRLSIVWQSFLWTVTQVVVYPTSKYNTHEIEVIKYSR